MKLLARLGGQLVWSISTTEHLYLIKLHQNLMTEFPWLPILLLMSLRKLCTISKKFQLPSNPALMETLLWSARNGALTDSSLSTRLSNFWHKSQAAATPNILWTEPFTCLNWMVLTHRRTPSMWLIKLGFLKLRWRLTFMGKTGLRLTCVNTRIS